ncbi:MAG: hypothetical protein WA364_24260 [Candidatus Nitrosopolaris sp.]
MYMEMRDWIILFIGVVIAGAVIHSITTSETRAYQAVANTNTKNTNQKCPPGFKPSGVFWSFPPRPHCVPEKATL